MVDTQLLEEKIAQSGKTRVHLAKACGFTVQTLRLKVNGRYDFTNTQTDILCSELGITSLAERQKIFFKK